VIIASAAKGNASIEGNSMTSQLESTPALVDEDTIARYRKNGFVHIPSVLSSEEVGRYREAAGLAYNNLTAYTDPSDTVFRQIIQVWKSDETLRALTFNHNLAVIATQLAGVPVRLWHDQLLVKAPHNGAATEFHQDAPYWPHANSRQQLSAWIALVDVPVERGCMTFIPGSHDRLDVRPADLHDKRDFFDAAPELVWEPRVTIPLRAGDCTFHSGYTAHTANRNDTDEPRFAFVNIYVDANLTYTGESHPCTDGLGIAIGDRLPDDEFPRLPR
jgi:phytanoyl-CoA hydroxylase